MQYFDSLPRLVKTDAKGNASVYTNLMARASVISSLMSNPAVYYTYDIQDGDTPEIIAHKYYGSVYRYWIVLFANNIIDPQWNWPMSGDVFNEYINSKYTEINPYSTIHQYQKIITQVDSGTNETTTNTVSITEEEYDSLVEGTHTYSLPTGSVTVTTTKNAQTVYDWEYQLNENNRNIKLLKSVYVDQIESEFRKLMAA
jgi:hypothetical protein